MVTPQPRVSLSVKWFYLTDRKGDKVHFPLSFSIFMNGYRRDTRFDISSDPHSLIITVSMLKSRKLHHLNMRKLLIIN